MHCCVTVGDGCGGSRVGECTSRLLARAGAKQNPNPHCHSCTQLSLRSAIAANHYLCYQTGKTAGQELFVLLLLVLLFLPCCPRSTAKQSPSSFQQCFEANDSDTVSGPVAVFPCCCSVGQAEIWATSAVPSVAMSVHGSMELPLCPIWCVWSASLASRSSFCSGAVPCLLSRPSLLRPGHQLLITARGMLACSNLYALLDCSSLHTYHISRYWTRQHPHQPLLLLILPHNHPCSCEWLGKYGGPVTLPCGTCDTDAPDA